MKDKILNYINILIILVEKYAEQLHNIESIMQFDMAVKNLPPHQVSLEEILLFFHHFLPEICHQKYRVFSLAFNEYTIKVNKLESDIKRSNERINKKVNDAVHQTSNKYQFDIDMLKKEINQLKKDNVNEIADINQQHHQEIKEYQDARDKLLDDKEELNRQLKEYESKDFNYAIQYNNLRQEIINISWLDAVRNKHKAIAKEYPPLKIGADSTTIDINTKD